jgi:hypothetical protein
MKGGGQVEEVDGIFGGVVFDCCRDLLGWERDTKNYSGYNVPWQTRCITF